MQVCHLLLRNNNVQWSHRKLFYSGNDSGFDSRSDCASVAYRNSKIATSSANDNEKRETRLFLSLVATISTTIAIVLSIV